jgi:hypothetical protein
MHHLTWFSIKIDDLMTRMKEKKFAIIFGLNIDDLKNR